MCFRIDISSLLDSVNISREQAKSIGQGAVVLALHSTYEQIRKEANDSLKSTRSIYKANINRPEIQGLKGSIELTGKLPNMIEQGASAFDMKEGFKKSSKAKNSGNGWYLTIPYRHGSPNALGENQAFASVMPTEIYDAMQGKTPQITNASGGVTQRGTSLTMSDLRGTKYGSTVTTRGALTSNFGSVGVGKRGGYTGGNPYQGMIRSQKTYETATQGSYVTFRRVSENSDGKSWIHRGFKAYDLMLKGLQNAQIEERVSNFVANELTKMGV
jgi:hypothetical protein